MFQFSVVLEKFALQIIDREIWTVFENMILILLWVTIFL